MVLPLPFGIPFEEARCSIHLTRSRVCTGEEGSLYSLLDTSTADRFYPCSISNSTSVCVVPVCTIYLFTNKTIAKKILWMFLCKQFRGIELRQNLQAKEKSLSDHHYCCYLLLLLMI